MNASGKGQIAAYLAAAVLLLVGGAYLLRGDDGSAPASGGVALDGAGGGAQPGGGAGGSPVGAGSTSNRPVFVHVAGAVRRPGIYEVPPGSRVAAAVRKAGGLTRRADLTAFNLAAGVRDAQQVIVPRRGEAATAAAAAGTPGAAVVAGGGTAAPGAPGQPISLSTATPEQLDGIDGIGPKLAQAIIGYRNQHKGFKSVEELREVDGIGEKRFAALRKAVRP
jgi:competence protein ComEA